MPFTRKRNCFKVYFFIWNYLKILDMKNANRAQKKTFQNMTKSKITLVNIFIAVKRRRDNKMKMNNPYIKSLKLTNDLILTISSSPIRLSSLWPGEKPFNQTSQRSQHKTQPKNQEEMD